MKAITIVPLQRNAQMVDVNQYLVNVGFYRTEFVYIMNAVVTLIAMAANA